MPDSLPWLGYGLMVVALTLGGYQVFRLFSVQPCPTCHQWVSRRLIRLKRSCPHCRHSLCAPVVSAEPLDAAVLEPESSSHVRSGSCARCGATPSGTPMWRLWDDCSYCKECLDRTAPSLWPIVEQQQLQNRTPLRSGQLFIRGFALFAILLGTVDFVVVLAGMLSGHWHDGSTLIQRVLLVSNLLSVPLFVPGLLLGVIASNASIRICQGVIRHENMGWTMIARLQDVTWHAGRSSELTATPLLGLLRIPVIVIDWPRDCDTLRRKLRTGVGFDLVSRERWAQFLTLAGVPVTPGRAASFDQ